MNNTGTYELDRVTMEAERNAAEDNYFDARPHLDYALNANIFAAGYERGWNERNKMAKALQARIDALMLEYCPDEMTAEQLAEWAKNQKPAGEPGDE